MKDFHDWVEEWTDTMAVVNGVINTHKFFEGVKTLSGKREWSPCDLSTNSQGTPLDDATAVVAAWEEFLTVKFVVTEAEAKRLTMEVLPPTQDTDQLEVEEILQGMQNMNNDKARGPDDISIIIYK